MISNSGGKWENVHSLPHRAYFQSHTFSIKYFALVTFVLPDRDHEAGHEADLHPNLGLDPVHVNPTSLPAQTRAKMPTNLSMEKERIQYNCQSLIVFPPSFYSPNHLFFSFLVDSSTFFLGCRCYYDFFCHVLSRSADYMSAAVLIDIYSATISFSFFSFSYFFPNLSWHSITISLCR